MFCDLTTQMMMRRRYNSAPGFLQPQYDVNISNYHVGIFNQYLGGPASVPATQVPATQVPVYDPSEQPGNTQVVPTATNAAAQSNWMSTSSQSPVQPNCQSNNNGGVNSDWSSTNPCATTSSTFIPIPSPLPWSICSETHPMMPNSSGLANEQLYPGGQRTPTGPLDSTNSFHPVPFSTATNFAQQSMPIPVAGGTPVQPPTPVYPSTTKRPHSMYPNADELTQHYLTLLQQVFPEHNSSALKHVLDRCGGDIINALENILACHAYRDGLLKTCMEVLPYPPANSDGQTGPTKEAEIAMPLSLSDADMPGTPPETSTTLEDLWSPKSAQLLTPSDLGQLQDLSQSNYLNNCETPPTNCSTDMITSNPGNCTGPF